MTLRIMQLSPYLNFKGQCEEAFHLYERVFEGKILSMLTYADAPAGMPVPDEWRKKICHATLEWEDNSLMGCDPPPDRFDAPQGVYLAIGIADPARAERIFNALSPKGQIVMPLQKTFWAVSFGMVRDQFGIPWMINCAENTQAPDLEERSLPTADNQR